MVSKLRCVSPIDGRYSRSTMALANYFSEHALQRYRVTVEVEYLKALSKSGVVRRFSDLELELLNGMKKLPPSQAEVIKKIEEKTNHDVKAVEYYIRDMLSGTSLEDVAGFVHFALTSEDVTNVAYALMLRDSLENVLVPKLRGIVDYLVRFANDTAYVPMLARTHGQPASPTTFGKEMAVFASRLESQVFELGHRVISAKLSGATGNFNAHVVAFPHVDWPLFSEEFIWSLELPEGSNTDIYIEPNLVTTQIEPHDSYCEVFDNVRRINSIFLDFTQDMWRYVSDGYLRMKPKEAEVGSSTMPHKVNPIDFENAEGNLGLANALFSFFSTKLPVSRLQRDLSDSTVLRNVGSAFAYSLIAYKSIEKGLGKVAVDEDKMAAELNSHPEVLAEAIQVVLKSQGVKDAYEIMKDFTRGKEITLESLAGFIDALAINEPTKKFLKSLRPRTYIGLAGRLILS